MDDIGLFEALYSQRQFRYKPDPSMWRPWP